MDNVSVDVLGVVAISCKRKVNAKQWVSGCDKNAVEHDERTIECNCWGNSVRIGEILDDSRHHNTEVDEGHF